MEGRSPADRPAEDQVRIVRAGSLPPFAVRLNRYLSQCGLGSRRSCEQIIQEGRVSINGHVIRELATQVGADDKVIVDGRPVRAESGVVIALNKPRGYICSRSDERDRMTIYALLPKQFQTLHHVGRLDKDSEGLLLLTNRGDLSHRLIHPSQGAEKEYEVIVDKPMDQETMAKLVRGMPTEEGHAKAERAWLATEYRAHVVLKQGLKRQIRLMFYQLGFEVERLTRTRIGWLELRGLPKGDWKELTATEVERFFAKDGGTGRAPKVPKVRRPETEAETPRPRSARPAAKRGGSDRRDSAPKGRSRFARSDRPESDRPARSGGAKPRPSGSSGPRRSGGSRPTGSGPARKNPRRRS